MFFFVVVFVRKLVSIIINSYPDYVLLMDFEMLTKGSIFFPFFFLFFAICFDFIAYDTLRINVNINNRQGLN